MTNYDDDDFKSWYFVLSAELKAGIRRKTNEFAPQLHVLFIDFKLLAAYIFIFIYILSVAEGST